VLTTALVCFEMAIWTGRGFEAVITIWMTIRG